MPLMYNSCMKKASFLILLALSSSLSFAGPDSINPEKTVTELFKVFGRAKAKDNMMEVLGPRYTGSDELEDEGNWFKVSLQVYKRAQDLAQSVFVTQSGEGSDSVGTSFSIGENLVLTNQHVLSPSRKNKTDCKQFEVTTNENKSESFDCKEVLFCEADRDYCLIEMKPNSSKKKIDGEKVVVYSHLSRIKALKLDTNYKFGETNRYSEDTFTAIGNTRGFGIHYSAAKKAYLNTNIIFFSPLAQGNSGGPILNQAGHVVGIVKQQSVTFYGTGTDVYNVAVPITEVVETLKQKLQNRPEVLAKLNKALLAP